MKKILSIVVVFFSLFFFTVEIGYAADESVVENLSLDIVAGEVLKIESGFKFNALGVSHYDGLRVRFTGGDWISFRQEEDDYGSYSALEYTIPISSFELLSDVDREVEVTLMMSKVSPPELVQVGYLSGNTQQFEIVSRAEWGADESWRTFSLSEFRKRKKDESSTVEGGLCSPIEEKFVNQYQQEKTLLRDESGYLKWPLSYSKDVKKLVVHHTAGELKDLNGDGKTDKNDYASVVKAIYKYHTFTRGWGDVGYHYFVDPLGNIYEGRAGGDKVVGAHVLCQNTGTVGVALLGNFETTRPSVSSFMGLARILQQQSLKYSVNPNGKSKFRGALLPHIVGHNAVGAVTKEYIGKGGTTCPGKNLDRMLSQLRTVVASGSFDGAPLGFIPYKDFDFQVDGFSNNQLARVTLEPIASHSVSVTLRNLGFHEWQKVELVPRQSSLRFLGSHAVGVSTRVQTGGSVSLSLPLASGVKGGRYTILFDIKLNGSKKSYGVVKVPVFVKRPNFAYKVKKMDGFRGTLLTGQTQVMQVTLQNTSNFVWKKDGDYQLALREVGRIGPKVVARRRGGTFNLIQDVPLNGEVTFTIPFRAPGKVGVVSSEWLPMIQEGHGLKGQRIVANIQVQRPRFAFTSVSLGGTKWLKKGENQVLQLGIKNTGNFDWRADETWLNIGVGNKVHLTKDVAQGEVYTLPHIVRTSYSDPILEVKGAVGNSQYGKKQQVLTQQFRTKGRALLKAQKISQSDSAVASERGVYPAWVEYKNTGNVPWYREGKERVELNVQDRMDFFDKDSWVSRKTAAILSQEIVMPGEIGRFEFSLKVLRKSHRVLSDSFLPIVNGKPLLGRGLKAKWGTGLYSDSVDSKIYRIHKVRTQKQEVKSEEQEQENPHSQILNSKQISNSKSQIQKEKMEKLRLKIQGKRVQNILNRSDLLVNEEPIRVWLKKFQEDKIGENDRVVIVGGKDGIVDISRSDLDDGKVFRVEAAQGSLLEVQNWVRRPAWSDTLNDNKFRGVLEVRLVPSVPSGTSPLSGEYKMILINELLLGDYMKGIAEVPEVDEQEKRKVIAVLSRSYAWHYVNSNYRKFPGRPYDAVDDPAVFQKYIGYGYESRAPLWLSAVKQTDGEVVMIESGEKREERGERILRAAYFSCSDGRTKSLAEAGWIGSDYFKDKDDVFVSVPDPLGDDPNRSGSAQCGHGVGVSGFGATNMAKEGKTYREIINYYYQNVKVDRF